MGEPQKVLILYASYGDGHLQVSKVLCQQFQRQGIEAKMVDVFEESHPFINRLMRFIYLKSYSIFPALYGLSYYMTRNMNHRRPYTRWFNSFGMKNLKKLIEREKATAVINTFPMLATAELKRKQGISIPIFTVFTDFVLHNRWIHQNIDKFYVPTEDLKYDIVKGGISETKVIVSGIPLRETFDKEFNLSQIKHRFSILPSEKVILLLAGAYGVLNQLEEICHRLAKTSYKVIVVCGKNEKLEQKLDDEFGKYDNIIVKGFIEEIHELMAMASCIITKPGGITLSESIHVERPILLFRPSPGQEKENAIYLQNKGVAIVAQHTDELIKKLIDLLENDAQYNHMVNDLKKLKKVHSSEVVVTDIIKQLQ